MVNGEITWDTELPKTNSNQKNDFKDTFLKLEEGKNQLRFITNPFLFYVHDVKVEGQKYAQKVRCAKSNSDDPCPLCDEGLRRKERIYAGVLDRKTGTTKILETNSVIYDTIKANKQEEDWGDPMGYDYNLKKNSKAPSPALFYTATPCPKKPLTADEQELVDKFDKQSIINLAKVPKLEKILEKLAKIRGTSAPVASVPQKSSVAQVAKQESSSSGDDDDDFKEFGE